MYSFIIRKVVHTPLNPAIVIPISVLSRISFCPLTYLTGDGNDDDFLRGKHTSSLTSVASFENWERVVVYLREGVKKGPFCSLSDLKFLTIMNSEMEEKTRILHFPPILKLILGSRIIMKHSEKSITFKKK